MAAIVLGARVRRTAQTRPVAMFSGRDRLRFVFPAKLSRIHLNPKNAVECPGLGGATQGREMSMLPASLHSDGFVAPANIALPKTFWRAIAWSYKKSFAFAIRCPLLFLIPVAAECAQHASEIHMGFYNSLNQAQDLAYSPMRWSLGHLKVILFLLYSYSTVRFVGFNDSRREARRFDASALRPFWKVLLLDLLLIVITLDGQFALQAIGASSLGVSYTSSALQIGLTLLTPGFAAWSAAAALSNAEIGIRRSFALSHGSWLWSLAFYCVSLIPPLAVHYLFFWLAVGSSATSVWSGMIVDAFLSGYLGALAAVVGYVIARHIADRRGVSLTPDNENPHR
jgi:hypothetical protein